MKKSNEVKLRESANGVALSGEVAKIIYQSDKVVKFNLCTFAISKNDKQIRRYVPVLAFGDFGLEEGDKIEVHGYISTDKNEYNNKTSYDVVVHAEILEEWKVNE